MLYTAAASRLPDTPPGWCQVAAYSDGIRPPIHLATGGERPVSVPRQGYVTWPLPPGAVTVRAARGKRSGQTTFDCAAGDVAFVAARWPDQRGQPLELTVVERSAGVAALVGRARVVP